MSISFTDVNDKYILFSTVENLFRDEWFLYISIMVAFNSKIPIY